MGKGDKGFTYPLVLAMLISFSTFLLVTSELLLIDKKMQKDEEAIFIQEYYLLSSLRKTEAGLQAETANMTSGTYLYKRGKVDYMVVSGAAGKLNITFSASIDGADPVRGYAIYDAAERKMVKWMEKN